MQDRKPWFRWESVADLRLMRQIVGVSCEDLQRVVDNTASSTGWEFHREAGAARPSAGLWATGRCGLFRTWGVRGLGRVNLPGV